MLNYIKDNITVILKVSKWVLLGLLVLCVLISNYRARNYRSQLNNYKKNERALIKENDSLKNKSQVYELSLKQLEYLNDSITIKMNKVMEELRIQKNKVTQVQYIETVTEVHDSIRFIDTLFVNDVKIDTTLTDGEWYSVDIHMAYPNYLTVSPSFNDEYYIIMESKKETINEPSKVFFIRWFQKKQTVIETTVHNKNPHSKTVESRFINIIRK